MWKINPLRSVRGDYAEDVVMESTDEKLKKELEELKLLRQRIESDLDDKVKVQVRYVNPPLYGGWPNTMGYPRGGYYPRGGGSGYYPAGKHYHHRRRRHRNEGLQNRMSVEQEGYSSAYRMHPRGYHPYSRKGLQQNGNFKYHLTDDELFTWMKQSGHPMELDEPDLANASDIRRLLIKQKQKNNTGTGWIR